MLMFVPLSGCVASPETRILPLRVRQGAVAALASRHAVVSASMLSSISLAGFVLSRNVTSQYGVSIAGSGVVRVLPSVLTSMRLLAGIVQVAGATARTSGSPWN